MRFLLKVICAFGLLGLCAMPALAQFAVSPIYVFQDPSGVCPNQNLGREWSLSSFTEWYCNGTPGMWTRVATATSLPGPTGAVPVNNGSGTPVYSGCIITAGALTCPLGTTSNGPFSQSGAAIADASPGTAAARPVCSSGTVEAYLATDTHALTICSNASGVYAWSATLNPTGSYACYFSSTLGGEKCITDAGVVANIGVLIPLASLPVVADVKVSPAANCSGSTAGAGWNLPGSGGFSAACRAGTNNLNGVLQGTPNATAYGTFDYELPSDWVSSSQTFIKIYYSSGSNTSGTVIWTISSACSKGDGSVSDDAAYVAESAMATQSMAVANRDWAQTAPFAQLTSGNGCIAGSHVRIKVALSGTASSAVNVSMATLTVPRQMVIQGN